ncbi:MAG: DNA repair protein RadA [Thiomargarita sp.]|nr:DNA repair protein RadA [Thiomargarita sp.]
MAQKKHLFMCTKCATTTAKWAGQCPDCKEWNCLEETTQKKKLLTGYTGSEACVSLLSTIEASETFRMSTNIAELDRVLGGGLVSGSVILIGGDPGIGKSTLLLQTISKLSQILPNSPLYVTGEESPQQVSLRAKRLGLNVERVKLLIETQVETILNIAKIEQPQVMVIDSIQTIYTDASNSAPGSVSQIRDSAAQLVRFAKQNNIAVFLVGHVTKEGALAGPRILEHMVDAVLYFEGDTGTRFRVIRAIKNRFGAINEIGVFAMTDKGLKEVSNPSAIFLSGHESEVPGCIIMVTHEGTRPLLVEVQALVDKAQTSNPRRVVLGLEQNRLSILLTLLHKHTSLKIKNKDVYVSVVGGVKISDTGADLAVLIAVLTSMHDMIVPKTLVVFGEVGLTGEIRPVPNGVERLREAAKHGFTQAVVPKSNMPTEGIPGMTIIPVVRLDIALVSVLKQCFKRES